MALPRLLVHVKVTGMMLKCDFRILGNEIVFSYGLLLVVLKRGACGALRLLACRDQVAKIFSY